MNPIILLSMPQDEDRVRGIVGALSESDLDIYWDRTEPGSAKWVETTNRVMSARGAVFFWSSATNGQEAASYRILARCALAAGKAICVRLDGDASMDAMPGCTTYDLRGRRSRASSLFMLDVVAGVKAKAAGLDPPLPRAARQLLIRRLAVALPTAITVVAVGAGLYRDLGVDRIAGTEEAAAWARLRPGPCEPLRTFRLAHPDGTHAREAATLWDSRTVERRERRRPRVIRQSFFVGSSAEAGAIEEAARRDVMDRAGQRAEQICRGYSQFGADQFASFTVRSDRVDCRPFATGITCDFRGQAVCSIVEVDEVLVERCAAPEGQ